MTGRGQPSSRAGKRRWRLHLIKCAIVVSVVSVGTLTVPCPSCEPPIVLGLTTGTGLTDATYLTLATSRYVDVLTQMKATYGGFLRRCPSALSSPGRRTAKPALLRESEAYEIVDERVNYYVDAHALSVGVTEEDLVISILRRTELENRSPEALEERPPHPGMTKKGFLILHPYFVEEVLAAHDAGEPLPYECRPDGVGEQTFLALYKPLVKSSRGDRQDVSEDPEPGDPDPEDPDPEDPDPEDPEPEDPDPEPNHDPDDENDNDGPPFTPVEVCVGDVARVGDVIY